MQTSKVSFADIKEANERITSQVTRTPLLEYPELNELLGAKILVKPECLQRGGSFKFRGAFNRIAALSEQEASSGVVAWSSGNHAQGVALAAKLSGVSASIVMPKDAPPIKIENTRAFGAEVIFYDRFTQSRETIATELARKKGAVLIPSYDDPFVIAGQGTCGFEIIEQAEEKNALPDYLLVCCGGGGLIAGTSIAVKTLSPNTQVYSVEPDDFDDHKRSFVSGKQEQVSSTARSICDALLAPTPGDMTFPINQQNVEAGLSVSDEEVKQAMYYAFHTLKLVVEPGGAVALAALLSRKLDIKGKTVAIVLSGGNVSPDMYISAIKP